MRDMALLGAFSRQCENSRKFVDCSNCEPGQLLISILSPLTVHYISIKFAADLEENGNKNMDHITIYVKTWIIHLFLTPLLTSV